MAVKRLFVIPGGALALTKSHFTYLQNDEINLNAPVMITLFETDDGYVLYDTGLDSRGLKDPSGTWGKRAFVVRMQAEDDILKRLEAIKVSPQDVKYVIQSHLHWDHCGGTRYFEKAQIVVQKAEFRQAFYPDSHQEFRYFRNHLHPNFHYKLVEGDLELFSDVFLISTFGHTAGHQSLLVKLPRSGNILITGDAAPLTDNLRTNIIPGILWSSEYACASLSKLRLIQRLTHAKVIHSHDEAALGEILKSPNFYD